MDLIYVGSSLHTSTVKTFCFSLETNTSPIPKVTGARHNKLVRSDSWGWNYKLSEANLQGFTSYSAFRFQICFPSTYSANTHSEFYWEKLEVNLFIIKERAGFRALDGRDLFQFLSCFHPFLQFPNNCSVRKSSFISYFFLTNGKLLQGLRRRKR